ncbi:MAG TPA: phospho-N-acetylmuramoyl-pentapeptide-transferase [Acidimicrobiales bacterium]|nr:phospho-N-acetylmuramoyl-pentapeptide-transferase [Acidimicrobiales bacterium]
MIAIFTAGGIAILVSAFGTPILLRYLTSRQIGQQIREDGPARHLVKAGTPTMGGITMIIAMLAGYVLSHIGTGTRFTANGWLAVGAVALAGCIGLADDWIKHSRRRSLGLKKGAKFGLQVGVGVAFALGVRYWAHGTVSHPHAPTPLTFTRYDVPGVALSVLPWVVWATFIIVAESNAVNLTDGLDGLAAGSSALAFTGLALIGYWCFRHYALYQIRGTKAIDLAVVAVSMAGACIGFLWWNAAPARIFMGDTGSLAIGTGLACLALELNVALLLPILGGLFLLVTLSVVIQVISFRGFHRRVFRMAPLHHHFELAGWPETTVIVRFWIISGLCTGLGLGVFYANYLAIKGT